MLNLYPAHIERISVHKVGNKNRREAVTYSNKPLQLTDETRSLLLQYFLKSFREKEERYYYFPDNDDIRYELDRAAASIFENAEQNFHHTSVSTAKHLYEQASHPHIKSGEFYVVHFSGIMLDNKRTEAIGLFKSELKYDYLQFDHTDTSIDLMIQSGIDVNKLDKGALIFNTDQDNGYKVLIVDNNRYDTKYWIENFLGVEILADSNFYTKKYLKFCQDFAADVVRPSEDKQQEVLFMNRAVHHFASHDVFEHDEFVNDVFENPELIPDFMHYKVERGPKYQVEDIAEFEISNTAVKEARKTIKNSIKLDTNIEIKLDFINPESANKFVEKGWDEERQMYYYLVYFNKEQK